MTLRRVDRAIRQLCARYRRVPEHRYDFYVLSDHGQTACKTYRELNGGKPFERWIFDQLLANPPRPTKPDTRPDQGLAHGIRSRSRGVSGFFQHYLNYIDEDYLRRNDPEAYERDGVRVISAGPNAFFYLLNAKEPLDLAALEERFPGLAEKLSQSPGIGLVLARSDKGPVCFSRGKRYLFPESGAGPFEGRADAALVIHGIADLMAMPSAGDLVIYGTGGAEGHVSFIPERGAHAGPSADEMQTFIIRPAKVTLPASISHPVQLYDHFIRYQEPEQLSLSAATKSTGAAAMKSVAMAWGIKNQIFVTEEWPMAVKWNEDVDAALAEAKARNKPLLIDFSAAPA